MIFTRQMMVLAIAVLVAGNSGCRLDNAASGSTPAFQQLLSNIPQEADASDSAQKKINLLQAQATLCEMDNRTGEAVQLYETILTTAPKHLVALHRLAILHSQQGNYAGAEARFQEALDLAGNSAPLHNDYGYYCHLQGKTDAATVHLGHALALDPQLLEAHNNLGLVYARIGQFGAAELEFRRAGCSRAEALNNLAFSRLMATDFEAAAAAYGKAVQYDPNQASARRGLESLNKIERANAAGKKTL